MFAQEDDTVQDKPKDITNIHAGTNVPRINSLLMSIAAPIRM